MYQNQSQKNYVKDFTATKKRTVAVVTQEGYEDRGKKLNRGNVKRTPQIPLTMCCNYISYLVLKDSLELEANIYIL